MKAAPATIQPDLLEKRVKEILADLLLCDEMVLTPGALLTEDLGMDSLDRVEIVMQLEDQVLSGGAIDEEDADNWNTVADVLRTVEKEANNK